MSEPADLIPAPTSVVRNTMGKGNEQTLENKNRLASDAALREYYDKYYHQLLSIITEKVHKEKAQQDKLKEVTTHLNFEGCSRRNVKIQEVSQHSESRTPNIRGEHGKRQMSRRSRVKEEGKEAYSIGWEEERNPFPRNVTMKKRIHGEHKCSLNVKIAKEDTGSQD
nr:reverse transcriptase domain-containing protein [Tanacetum cinerariifolium]